MGVQTKADENLDKAREAVDIAILALSDIVVNECWGHDEFSEEFQENIEDSFSQLRAVKSRLKT